MDRKTFEEIMTCCDAEPVATTRAYDRMRALGRLKTGAMNKTEQAYARHLDLRRQAGEVLWFRFEGMKLRLADNTFYTPDFAVMAADGQLECHEVKGFWTDDARVKIKVAAEQYPLTFLAVKAKAKKDGGGWAIEIF
ncbi:hypothetical protein CR3_4301 [Cupriavidus gilardii CR3]|uniref:DUF1064 domain-containing protein n=2 Tax=Cupriavidus gilardii TaxID=82541 RepID=A0A849BJH2_9BURK|nr:DUF1064 domain-containing protein [Cupriavidus gilardii]ALD93483.1 hypothetical protein CR3_4301 [Cupriavidus gilardii CR3]KAB0592800.1 DUF1064 domain-containing protein [Cupriavidus gilardii]MCT9017158.1 DUF1064 domain-containing protein [Cupriavidus gilardii]MCT9056821.1 DUF1064 domain-containing protein [Cupriavidus gilardii]NNH14294.1 DUF1064 domain-containing protein [Cupriavidus gilardii]